MAFFLHQRISKVTRDENECNFHANGVFFFFVFKGRTGQTWTRGARITNISSGIPTGAQRQF